MISVHEDGSGPRFPVVWSEETNCGWCVYVDGFPVPYMCTRPKGHVVRHAAQMENGYVVVEWDDEDGEQLKYDFAMLDNMMRDLLDGTARTVGEWKKEAEQDG